MARRHASTTIFEQMRSALAQAGAPDTLYRIEDQELKEGGRRFLKAVAKLSKSERERFDNEYAFAIEQLLARTFDDAQRVFTLWADYKGLTKKNIGDSAFSKHYMVFIEGPLKRTEFTEGYLERWGKALEMTAHEDFTVLTVHRPYPDNFDAFVKPLLETPWEKLHTLRFFLGSDFARQLGVKHSAWALGEMCKRWGATLEHVHLDLPRPRHFTRNSPIGLRGGYSTHYNRTGNLYDELTENLLGALLEHAPETLREITLWNWPDSEEVLSTLLEAFPALTRLTFMSAGGRAHLKALRESPHTARLEGLRLSSWSNHLDLRDLEHQRESEKLSLELGAKGLKHWHYMSQNPDPNQRHVFTWAHPWRDLFFEARKRVAGIEISDAPSNAHNAIRFINVRSDDLSPQLWHALLHDREGAPRQFQRTRTLVTSTLGLESLALLLGRLSVCFPNLVHLNLSTGPLPDEGVNIPEIEASLAQLESLQLKMEGSSSERQVELVRALLGAPERLPKLTDSRFELEHLDAHAEAISLAAHHKDSLHGFSLTNLTDGTPLEDYLDRLLEAGLADIIEKTRGFVNLWSMFSNGDAFARYLMRDHLPDHFRRYLILNHLDPRSNLLKAFFVEAAQTFDIASLSSMRKEEVIAAIADHLGVEPPAD